MKYEPLKIYSPEEFRGMDHAELMIMFEEAKKLALIYSGKCLRKIHVDIGLIRKVLKG